MRSPTSFAIPKTSECWGQYRERTLESGSWLTTTYFACSSVQTTLIPALAPGRKAMNKLIICVFLISFTVSDIHGQTQTHTTSGTPSKQRAPTSFSEKILKFFGISDSPSTLKGPGDEVTSGELWLGDLDTKTTR